MNTPNNAAALERLEQKWREDARYLISVEREDKADSLTYCADELAKLRATLAQPDASWKPSSNDDYDRSIHSNPDASAWADFFVQTFPGQAAHRDLMLGWFANAMMAMHDHLKTKPDALTSQPSGEAVSIPVVQQTAPERIWLAVADDAYYADKPFPDGEEVCWSSDAPLQVCVPYVRADLATHPSADAQGVAVDEAMVDRAAKAYCKWFVCGSNGVNTLALRAALTAALAPKPEGGHG